MHSYTCKCIFASFHTGATALGCLQLELCMVPAHLWPHRCSCTLRPAPRPARGVFAACRQRAPWAAACLVPLLPASMVAGAACPPPRSLLIGMGSASPGAHGAAPYTSSSAELAGLPCSGDLSWDQRPPRSLLSPELHPLGLFLPVQSSWPVSPSTLGCLV